MAVARGKGGRWGEIEGGMGWAADAQVMAVCEEGLRTSTQFRSKQT